MVTRREEILVEMLRHFNEGCRGYGRAFPEDVVRSALVAWHGAALSAGEASEADLNLVLNALGLMEEELHECR